MFLNIDKFKKTEPVDLHLWNKVHETMKLAIFVCSVVWLILCVRHSDGISHDSIIGYCSNVTRNPPCVSKIVHKPNNRYFKMFRKTDVTIRFPEVFCLTSHTNSFDLSWQIGSYFIFYFWTHGLDWRFALTNYMYHVARQGNRWFWWICNDQIGRNQLSICGRLL